MLACFRAWWLDLSMPWVRLVANRAPRGGCEREDGQRWRRETHQRPRQSQHEAFYDRRTAPAASRSSPSCAARGKKNAQRLPDGRIFMSASLIGRLGSSTFRLSAAAVSMSLTGSCFSSESAPRPFHHGIRRRGGTICSAALPSNERQVQADMRTHLIHRPARDIIPPLGGARVSSYRM